MSMNPAEFANIRKSEEDFWWYRGMRSILFRMMEPYLAGRPIGRALEAGCGTGYLCHRLQLERGWPIVAMDLSGDGLRYAREMGADRPVQADIRALPFPAGAFDLVMSIDVLAHLAPGQEQKAARELARVLAPGGLLVMRTAALDMLRSRHSEFAFEQQRFTGRRLMGLVSDAGVRVLRCTYANSLLMPVALAKFRIWEPLMRQLMRQPASSGVTPVAPWLDHALYAPLALEAAWIGAGHDLRVGQSLILIGEKMV